MKKTNKTIGKATRPIFIPNPQQVGVIDFNISFDWHMGMSAAVKRRSIQSLHKKAGEIGFSPILEISSKSMQKLGMPLSAFFLKNTQGYFLENIFQSSKIFQKGGIFIDLLSVSPKEAKRDARLKNSGQLTGFHWLGKDFPLKPKTLFYDWIYIKTLNEPHNIQLRNQLLEGQFSGFSDIEFNPNKSLNCQARSVALFCSLVEYELLDDFIAKPEKFVQRYDLYSDNKNLKLFF